MPKKKSVKNKKRKNNLENGNSYLPPASREASFYRVDILSTRSGMGHFDPYHFLSLKWCG